MALFKTYTQIRDELVAGLALRTSKLSDFRVGSRLSALISSFAAALSAGWIELAELKSIFFVSTASGEDLDARVLDFGLIRGQGTQATGAVLAFPPDGGSQSGGVVPAGTLLRTSDGRSVYECLQDRVVVPPFTAIPVMSIEVGAAHNLPAGTVLYDTNNQLRDMTILVGSSGVDNDGKPVGALDGGTDRESDESLRTRFPEYLKSLSRGTERAVRQALLGTDGVSSLVIENAMPVPGFIRISVANGSGDLPNELRQAIDDTMAEWAAAGVGYLLQAVAKRGITVSCKVYTQDTSIAPKAWQDAVSAGIRKLSLKADLGQSIYRSEIIKAGFLDGLDNFELLVPVTDEVAAPNEIITIESVSVQVIYV